MRTLKHLPLDQWPEADHAAFEIAYASGDLFDETGGPGAHLAAGTRKTIQTAYRRWLGFLRDKHPEDLLLTPAGRITPLGVRAFIERISAEVGATSLAMAIDNLYYAARLIAPDENWRWLSALRSRLLARAEPEDRFERLVPAWQTLDYGLQLMDEAIDLPVTNRKAREIQYRDGLILAVLSLWPIRRRSVAALTISRHLELDEAGVTLLLYPEDTKSKRSESFPLPDQLVPYAKRYLDDMRPRLIGRSNHDGLWASYRRRPLSEGRIYDIVRRLTAEAFGKPMGLHDIRRSASTFLAMCAPDKVGLIPGVLQHASPDVSDKHYNLARSTMASQRYSATISKIRTGLDPRLTPQKG